MISQKGYLTALTNFSKHITALWRGNKVFQILVSVTAVSLIAGGTFVSLKEYGKRKAKVFAATSAIQVELPRGIKKENLQNLTDEQKEKLDKQIASTLSTKIEKGKTPEESRQVVVVVLTQGGQPILPDLERKEEPSPIPTPIIVATPTASSEESGEAQATPTPGPCNDTDPTQDIYIKGECQDKDKKVADVCEGDGITLDQYGCDWSTLLCTLRKSNCTYNCFDGRCLKPDESELGLLSPTPTPSRSLTPTTVLSPTVTPTPTNVPCVDTDGGKDIYTKGTVTTWGKSYNDTCYSVQTGETTNQCSDYYCRLLEYSCQPLGYQGEPFTCQHGCKDGACLTQPPSPTPTPKTIITPTLTPTPTPTVPAENELTFVYEGGVEQSYKNLTEKELKDTIDKIYQSMKKILGPPFNNNTVRVKLGPDYSYSEYNVSTNELTLAPQQFNNIFALLGQMFYAFYDDSIYYFPSNWHHGFYDFATTEVQIDAFIPERKSQMRTYNNPFYELTASSPAWASKDGKISGTFNDANHYNLLAMTFYKLYLEDNQFFAKFNKQLYQQTFDNTLPDKLASIAAGVKPTVEGMPFNDWYDNHYLLQVKPIPGKYLTPYLEISGSQISIIVKAVEVLADGTKKESSDRQSYVQIFDSNNNRRHDYGVAHYDSGGTDIGKMPTYETTPNISSSFKGAMRFDINMTNFAQVSFYYPYQNGQPIIPGREPIPGVFGTINRSEGYVRFKGSGLSISSIILEGMFQSKVTFFDTRGPVELSFYSSGQNLPPGQSGSSPKTITKDFGDYYTTIRLLSAASSTRGSPSAQTPGNCTEGWQDYEDEDFKLKFKIPSGWTDNSVDEHQSETLIYRHLISTTIPEQQLDPKYKVSYFDILASTEDLKDSDYGMWLENNTGNQQKSQVDFKGISAEKYTDDTQMPCASQTEEGVSCDYHSETYYFEKDDIYYLLALGIYTSPDVKEQNETNLKCFLENFELSDQEEANLIPCPDDLFSTAEQLKEQQEDWWEKPDPCDSRPEQKVCGYTRSIFDNGVIQISNSDYRNSYCYCSFFEKNGSRTYRGTEMFSLGYKEGVCKEKI